MVPDLVYKPQIICLRGTYVIDLKPNAGRMDMQTWVRLNAPDVSGGA